MAVLCYQSTCAESLSTLRLLLLQDLRMLNLPAETNMGFFLITGFVITRQKQEL